MDHSHRPAPSPQLWTAPAVAAALATCDLPTIMDSVREDLGWTQEDLATALGYSQSWVSKVLRRQLPLTVSQVRDVCEMLDIPLHLLRFGDPGDEDPTNRRQFTKAAALAALSVPTARAGEIDVTTATTLRTITGGQRRLDATTPAQELAKGAIAHLEMASRLASKSSRSPFATDISAAASEAAGFAAWLHADMHDTGSARTYYRTAITHARNSGNDLLRAYMLGSFASFEIESDDPRLGLVLTREARQLLGDPPSPTAEAWLSSIEAVGYGSLPGKAAQSDTAINRAERAVYQADRRTAPPWPWVFPFDYAKMAGYRALAAVRLGRPNAARTAFAESVPAASSSPKQRAILMLELADVHLQAGDVDEGFRLATTALAAGRAYASERVIQHARRFRRRYSGHPSKHVHDFDGRLRATLL